MKNIGREPIGKETTYDPYLNLCSRETFCMSNSSEKMESLLESIRFGSLA